MFINPLLTWRGKVKDLLCQKQIHIVLDSRQSSLPLTDKMVVAGIWVVPAICKLDAKFVGIISRNVKYRYNWHFWCVTFQKFIRLHYHHFAGSGSMCVCLVLVLDADFLPCRDVDRHDHMSALCYVHSHPSCWEITTTPSQRSSLSCFRLTMLEMWAREGPITSSLQTGFFSTDSFEYLFRMTAGN